MAVGEIGDQKQAGSFVACWWAWWISIQPEERANFGGMLSCPTTADWSLVIKLHGRNGLLQVMASLLWWGEAVTKTSPFDQLDWAIAVDDVARVLEEMVQPGVIKRK
jgi:hypothetical protein